MTAAKAVVGFIVSFVAALLLLVQDATTFGDLTPFQWCVAILSAVVTAGGVYVVPNKPTVG